MQRMARWAAGNAGLNPCAHTLVKLKLGTQPAARMQQRVVQQWLQLWRSAEDSERADIEEAWRLTHRKLDKAGPAGRSSQLCGPLGAMVATLLDIGWVPFRPGRWITEDRAVHARVDLEDGSTDREIFEAIRAATELREWAKAARHYNGGCLEDGPPKWSHRTRTREALSKDNEEEAKIRLTALEAVMAGGTTCGDRYKPPRLCTRCSEGVVETSWHIF